jgi:hypothetical protein
VKVLAEKQFCLSGGFSHSAVSFTHPSTKSSSESSHLIFSLSRYFLQSQAQSEQDDLKPDSLAY